MTLDLALWAKSFGWSDAAPTEAQLSPQVQAQFQTWLKSYKGPGMSYLQKRSAERLDPRAYLANAQTVLVFMESYFPGRAPDREPDSSVYRISNYAWGGDYHERLRGKLQNSVEALQKILPAFDYKICVDTAPVLEKAFAVQAGLGWQGKNTLLLHRASGSYAFLGELITSIPLSAFQARSLESDHCGTCQRCLEACPTQALSPYVLHASRCISFWNLEHRGPIPADAPSFHGWIAGCDICQDVCPWNAKVLPVADAPKPLIFDANDPQTAARLQNTALSYLPQEKWEQNLAHLRAKSSS